MGKEGGTCIVHLGGWVKGCILHLQSVTRGHPSRAVMMIPATMIRMAAPRTAIAISAAEYLVFFFGCALFGRALFIFFFLRVFFAMVSPWYPNRGGFTARRFDGYTA